MKYELTEKDAEYLNYFYDKDDYYSAGNSVDTEKFPNEIRKIFESNVQNTKL